MLSIVEVAQKLQELNPMHQFKVENNEIKTDACLLFFDRIKTPAGWNFDNYLFCGVVEYAEIICGKQKYQVKGALM